MRKCLFLIFFLCIHGIRAQDVDGVLPRFEQISEADGLNSNGIRHILQLPDGRMVVTTNECFNVLNGKDVKQYSLAEVPSHPLSNYHGSYHVYVDGKSRLWLKDNGRVWCLNLQTGQPEDLSDWQMDDLFVDGWGRIWNFNSQENTINSVNSQLTTFNLQSSSFNLEPEWGELQDMDADSLRMYLFVSTSIVACYNLNNHALEYTSQPLDSAEAKFYDKTSLVVRSQDGDIYQLRCGEQRNIFMCFSPETCEWRTVFETTQGTFNTLCIPNPQLALMVCPEGMWKIDLETGKMQLYSEVITQKGDTLHTGFNTVFCDRDGGVWLGSFDNGLLYAPSIHAPHSYLIYYIVAVLVIALLLIISFFFMYARRMKMREQRLMKRLRKIVSDSVATSSERISKEEKEEMSVPENEQQTLTKETLTISDNEDIEAEIEEDPSPFIQRCAALVEQNLNTPGYNVERLAADLCMERTGLYKKLTEMLDQTPTLFIRSIRMEQAARLLREGQLSVSEVAERTGFSSASYFSRLFQKTYGCNPSEYVKSQF